MQMIMVLDSNNVMAKSGTEMPWVLPEYMQVIRKYSTDTALVGRNAYEHIYDSKPILENTYVLTRLKNVPKRGAVKYINKPSLAMANSTILGGKTTYNTFANLVTMIIVMRLTGRGTGKTFNMPNGFKLKARTEYTKCAVENMEYCVEVWAK